MAKNLPQVKLFQAPPPTDQLIVKKKLENFSSAAAREGGSRADKRRSFKKQSLHFTTAPLQGEVD